MDWADRIGRRIRFRDLHILLAVAERGIGEGILPPLDFAPRRI